MPAIPRPHFPVIPSPHFRVIPSVAEESKALARQSTLRRRAPYSIANAACTASDNSSSPALKLGAALDSKANAAAGAG